MANAVSCFFATWVPHTKNLGPAYYLLASNSLVPTAYSFALAHRLGVFILCLAEPEGEVPCDRNATSLYYRRTCFK